MPQSITEEDKVHEEWYKARPSLEDLPEFMHHLAEDYQHDYGTICHAIAASAVAAARAMDKSPSGGITGFQAGCVMWEMIRHWMYDGQQKYLRLVDYDDLLYPQYEEKFRSITPETWKWLQKEAEKKLAEPNEFVHPNVRSHWQRIVNGEIPFGFTVRDD